MLEQVLEQVPPVLLLPPSLATAPNATAGTGLCFGKCDLTEYFMHRDFRFLCYRRGTAIPSFLDKRTRYPASIAAP